MSDAARHTLDELLRTGAWLVPAADQVHAIDEAGRDPESMVVVLCATDTAVRLGMRTVPPDPTHEDGFQGMTLSLTHAVAMARILGLDELPDVLTQGSGHGRVQVLVERTGGWAYASVPLDDLRALEMQNVEDDETLLDPRVNAPGGSA